MGEMGYAHNIFIGKPGEKGLLARSTRKLEHNIKTDFKVTGFENADFIRLAQNRVQWRVLVNIVVNLRVP
jgi:hypothetical protein